MALRPDHFRDANGRRFLQASVLDGPVAVMLNVTRAQEVEQPQMLGLPIPTLTPPPSAARFPHKVASGLQGRETHAGPMRPARLPRPSPHAAGAPR